MKKFIILIFLVILAPRLINTMEESTQEITNWDKLPVELKFYILSLVLESDNYEDLIGAMIVSKEHQKLVKELLNDQSFLNDFAKRLVQHNPTKAKKLLQAAAEHDNVALTKVLINASDDLKRDAIYYLTFSSVKPTTRETLLKTGIGINIINKRGYTGLIEALFQNNLEVGKWFINHGADINQIDAQGKTITDWINEYFVAGPYALREKWLQLIHNELPTTSE